MFARQNGSIPSTEAGSGFFARGVNFYKLFWIFLLASFLGALAETAFMLLTRGELQNRSGVLYGPFSLVWGMGAVLFTLCFYRLKRKRDWGVFLGGALMGAVYEYLCSWLQEALFGACFWDYSHLPLNINGRVSLLFALLWGFAALLWVRELYPRACRWIAKIPNRCGRPLTWGLAALMAVNVGLSALALERMDARQLGQPPRGAVEVFLDRRWPDEKLARLFTNYVYIGTPEAKIAAGVGVPPA